MRYLFRLNSNEDENAKYCHAVAAWQYWGLKLWVQSDVLSAKVGDKFQKQIDLWSVTERRMIIDL